MVKTNLKKKNLSGKPLQKRQVSSGVFSMEKNPKSETLVIAREQSDRSNLRDASGLLLSPRRDRNDKGVIGRNFGFLILNFKFWHKTFAAEKARLKTFTMFQGAWNAIVRCLDKVCGFEIG